MGLTVKENQVIIPAGRHLALCYGVVDLGSQPNKFEPGKFDRRVKIFFELSDLIVQFIEGESGRPAGVSKEYNPSLTISTELRKHLESWRGKEFTIEERKGFDLFKILGKPAMLEVYHKQQNKGGIWVEIQQIYTAPKGSLPPQFNETLKFSFEDYQKESTPESFLKLPENLQKRIAQSREWSQLPSNLRPTLDFVQAEEVNEEEIF